jgi:hypothetical protein
MEKKQENGWPARRVPTGGKMETVLEGLNASLKGLHNGLVNACWEPWKVL